MTGSRVLNAAEIWSASSASRAGRGGRRAAGPPAGGPVRPRPGGRPDPGGAAGRNAADGRGPSSLGQQAVVLVRPPRQPGRRHLGCGQAAGRLGRGQQAEPAGMLVGRDPGQLVVVNRDQVGQHGGQLGGAGTLLGAQVEQRGLRAGRGWGTRHGDRPAAQPGGRGGQVGRLAARPRPPSSSASVRATSWQRSTRTPDRSSAGYSSAVDGHTQRTSPERSRSRIAAARSATTTGSPALASRPGPGSRRHQDPRRDLSQAPGPGSVPGTWVSAGTTTPASTRVPAGTWAPIPASTRIPAEDLDPRLDPGQGRDPGGSRAGRGLASRHRIPSHRPGGTARQTALGRAPQQPARL